MKKQDLINKITLIRNKTLKDTSKNKALFCKYNRRLYKIYDIHSILFKFNKKNKKG